jgi:hypothetical protein
LPPNFCRRARHGNLAGATGSERSRAINRPESGMYRAAAVVALGVLLASGCTRAAQLEGDRETIYQAESELVIHVLNRSQLDAVIYLVHDGTRERLGTATASASATFRVRSRQLASGEFVLLADPIGATRVSTSETLRTSQGSDVTWTLESDFRGSVLVRD